MDLKKCVLSLSLSWSIFLSLSGKATTFVETSIEDRLRTANGIVKVQYLGESYKKLPTGQIVTELTVKVLESTGINSSEIINHNNFKILMPGGLWQGRRFKVSGVPQFKQGEVATLILKKSEFGFILPNLAMSKFVEKTVDNEKFLISTIFPEKSGIGKIKEKDFKILAAQTFGKDLSQVSVDKYVSRPDEFQGKKRNPASMEQEKKEEESIPTFWFVVLLGILGFIPAFILRGKRNED